MWRMLQMAFCFALLLVASSFLIAFSQSVSSVSNESSECDGCSAYNCYEKIFHCGQNGYFLAFGEKYCSRFNMSDNLSQFTSAGRKFLRCTTACLLSFLDRYFEEDHKRSCSSINLAAFDSHVECYLSCDFCKVCKTDMRALLGSYDFLDVMNFSTVKQAFRILAQCGGPLGCMNWG